MTVSTRNRLLAAAQAVIAEDGWAAATTRRVAERADLAPGLVHYHAGTIEQLRRDAMLDGIQSFFAQSLEGIHAPAPGGPADVTVVSDWVRALIDLDRPSPKREQSIRLLQESLVLADRDEQLRTRIAGLVARYRMAVADGLAVLGVREPLGTAATIAAITDGVLLQKMLDPDLDLTPIIASIEDLIASRRPPSQ